MNLIDSMRYALLKLEEADVALSAVERNLRATGKDITKRNPKNTLPREVIIYLEA